MITDQTELRKIKCMEKAGISITRELMWWWGVRLATVQQLLELLQELEFYRAAQVIADCKYLLSFLELGKWKYAKSRKFVKRY